MPLYEYECRVCHRHTEKIQKFSDPEITVCPHCGGTLERVISAPAIAFKGGGWYADGYGNAKPKSGGEGKAGESKTDGKGSESKSDSGSKSSDSSSSSSKDSSASSASSASTSSSTTASAPAASSSSSDKK